MKCVMIAALSADGFIARHAEELADWTSKEDKKLFVEVTKRAGVMVMGRTTFETIGRALPGRRMIVMTSRPDGREVEGVEFTNETPDQLVDRLSDECVEELAVCGGSSIYGQFLAAGLITELYLTIEPILFGRGISLSSVGLNLPMKLEEVRQLSAETVLLRYTC